MKRICGLLLTLALVLGLCACGSKAPAWQEQYDLGVKYLSEGNYQEAIIAFTAAIEIDPKRPEAYIGLADVYTAQGDTDAAKKALEDGLAATGDSALRERLDALDVRDPAESGGQGPVSAVPGEVTGTLNLSNVNSAHPGPKKYPAKKTGAIVLHARPLARTFRSLFTADRSNTDSRYVVNSN